MKLFSPNYVVKGYSCFLGLLLMLALSGCGPYGTYKWLHPEKTDITADEYECQLEAEQRLVNLELHTRDTYTARVKTREFREECLEYRGWEEKFVTL